MIRCNLSLLLAERNLKITKVTNDTGISRTTLTSLASNHAQGIQFGTINTLCNYLFVTPDQFFSYVPFDIIINSTSLTDDTLLVECSILEMFKKTPFQLKGIVTPTGIFSNNTFLTLSIVLCYDDDSGDESLKKFVISKFKSIPLPFFKDLELNILNSSEDIPKKYGNATITFYWDTQFQN
jgi:DNA-binding Xre family transcriptional regulator